MISLKYIPPEKPTSEKIKGKATMTKPRRVTSASLRLTFPPQGKKATMGQGGELHVLIKEAKNLMAMKTGGTSDSFVKGLVVQNPLCVPRTPPACRMNRDFALLQVPVPGDGKKHQAEDSGREEEPEPALRSHVGVQRCVAGAAEGDVSGADRVGQRGHAEQRVPGRSPSQLRNRYASLNRTPRTWTCAFVYY